MIYVTVQTEEDPYQQVKLTGRWMLRRKNFSKEWALLIEVEFYPKFRRTDPVWYHEDNITLIEEYVYGPLTDTT